MCCLSELITYVLLGASLLVAAYQDARERLVSDVVWVPGTIGIALAFYLNQNLALVLAVRVGLIALVGFVFSRYGSIGEADAIALVVIAADPSIFAPIPTLVGSAVVAGFHILYLYAKGSVGKTIQIPMDRFKAEAAWIPKAIVQDDVRKEVESDVNTSRESVIAEAGPNALIQVQYGVPTVAYLGVGFLMNILYLAIFVPGQLFSFP
jgi:Flp pilus assembly protein protease CpaA